MIKLSPTEQKRLALTEGADVDTHDPRNARYLKPLKPEADEVMALLMADAIVSASDLVWRQALVNARRLLRDRDYWELTCDREWLESAGVDSDWPAPLQ
jgi:hypothetical protein